MHIEELNELRDRNLIDENQHAHLGTIYSRKIFSVYYELRIILYLGVMLFTTGLGILIYKNIGDIGHLLSIIAIGILTIICFWYVFRFGQPYSDDRVKPSTPWFDYVVLSGCLLFVSLIGYLQFQYAIFDNGMGAATLVTSVFFFYIAYRFDHLGVLSLAITALASFFSISVSPQKWYEGDFLTESDHHHTALVFGAVMAAGALFLNRKLIKMHFTFTYINFASLIFLTGALAGMFINDDLYGPYLLALYVGSAATFYYGLKNRSFVFLLYAFIYAYIGTTFVLVDAIPSEPGFWFLYFLASCGGFVAFIITFRNYFKRAE